MSSLIGRSPHNSYKEILTVNHLNGLDATLRDICDGKGSIVPLALSTTQISLSQSIWPTTVPETNMVLRMSATTNQLEWVHLTTSDITEGTNEYFNLEKVRAAFTGANGIDVDQTTGIISLDGNSGSSGEFDETTFWMEAP